MAITWKTIRKKILDGKELDDADKDWAGKTIEAYWDKHPDVTHRFPRWKKILAWVCGYQYHDYNTIAKKVMPVPVPRERKLVFNRLKPFARTMLAKLCADVPTPGTVPSTSEYDDVQAAEIGDQLLDGLSSEQRLDFRDKDETIKTWLILTNRCALRVFWNKDLYGILDYARETKVDETTGEEEEVIAEVREPGDVDMEVISPFNFRADPLYADRKKMRWFLYGDLVAADEIEDEYELDEGSLTDGKKSIVQDTAFDLQQSDSGEFPTGTPERDEEVTGRTTLYNEFWTPDFYVFKAGNKILEYGVNKLEEIPALIYGDRIVPTSSDDKGIVYNDSPLRDAIPLQREYNRWVSLMSTALEQATRLKVMLPLGALISRKQFSDEMATFIDVNTAKGEPKQLKLDPLPAYVPTYKSDLEREFETVLNLHEASFGRLPERASHASGTLVSLLLEQDDSVLTPVLTMVNSNHAKVWSLALRMIRDNYGVGRLVRFTGRDGQAAVKKFRGADLRGNTDVKITSQTGLPKSRALRIEYLMKLREAGVLKDDKMLLELLEFGNVEKFFRTALVHERRAYRENDRIAENPGIQPQDVQGWVYPFEDHATHLTIHLRERLSVKAENWEQNQVQALDTHIQETQEKLSAQMQQQQEAQMQAQAAAGRAQGPVQKKGLPTEEAGARPTA